MESEISLKSSHVKCRILWSVIAILTLVAICLARPSYKITTFQRFWVQRDQGRALISRWQYAADPPEMSSDPYLNLKRRDDYYRNWMGAWDAVNSQFGNVCFTPEYVSDIEIERLIVDFEELDQLPITAETLDRAWKRIGETGPHGRNYATSKRPLFDQYYLPLIKQ